MSAQNARAGAYRSQDGQIVRGIHPMAQWQARAPPEWEGETNLRAVWREAHPVDFPPAAGRAYARFHAQSGMVCIAEFGFVQTYIRLDTCGDRVRRFVEWQLPEATTP